MHSRKEKCIYILASIYSMAIGILACRPIIAVGWEELLFLFVLIAILLGPLVYRFIRKIEDFRRRERSERNRRIP
jgi:hypothetical protein